MKHVFYPVLVLLLLVKCTQAQDVPAVMVLEKNGDRPVSSAAFSPDGKKIITANSWSEVRILDADTGKELHQFRGAPTRIASSLFSPDGKRMTLPSAPNAQIIDVDSGKELQQLEQSRRTGVEFMTFSPDGKKILTTGRGENYAIRIWDADPDSAHYGKEILKLEGQEKLKPGHVGYFTAAFTPDGMKIVATNIEESTVRIWDIDSGSAHFGQVLHKLEMDDSRLASVNISPDGKKMLTEEIEKTAGGHDTSSIRLWDIDSGSADFGKDLRKMTERARGAFSPDGKKIIMIVVDNFDRGLPRTIESVLDIDGNRKTMHTGTVQILDTESGEELHTLKMVVQVDTVGSSPILAAVFSPDGKKVAISTGKNLTIWDASLEQGLENLGEHAGRVHATSLAFSFDGKKLMATEHDWQRDGQGTTIRIIDLERWTAQSRPKMRDF